jgi:hypothetical protein
MINSALNGVSGDVARVTGGGETVAVVHAVGGSIVLGISTEAVLNNQVAVDCAPSTANIITRRRSMKAVRRTKCLVSIGMINSASDGISGGIIPSSPEKIQIGIAILLAGIIGGKGRIKGSAGSIDDAAVSFTRSTANIISIRRGVRAVVSKITGGDGGLRVVDSAGKGVLIGIINIAWGSQRIELTDLHARSIVVQGCGSHNRITITSGTLGERHIAISFTVGSTNTSSIRRSMRTVKSSISNGRCTSMVSSATDGITTFII